MNARSPHPSLKDQILYLTSQLNDTHKRELISILTSELHQAQPPKQNPSRPMTEREQREERIRRAQEYKNVTYSTGQPPRKRGCHF